MTSSLDLRVLIRGQDLDITVIQSLGGVSKGQ
jgi:hypothetical protein